MQPLVVSDGDDIVPVLRALFETAGRTVEGRLLSAVAEGRLDDLAAAVRDDVRSQLAQLRNNPELLRFLRRTGGLREFEAASERVIERLVGTQVQNLRGVEHSYVFFELPVDPESGLRHAQVHVFGDGRRGRDRVDADNATVCLRPVDHAPRRLVDSVGNRTGAVHV